MVDKIKIFVGIDTKTNDMDTYRDYLDNKEKKYSAINEESLGYYSLEDAIQIIDKDWIDAGNYSDQTIIDLANATRILFKEFKDALFLLKLVPKNLKSGIWEKKYIDAVTEFVKNGEDVRHLCGIDAGNEQIKEFFKGE